MRTSLALATLLAASLVEPARPFAQAPPRR
jgi:hypothetical protein